MNSLELIVRFNLDSTLSIMKIKWFDIVYDTSYKMFSQWNEDNLMHCVAICEKQNKMFELTFDNYFKWDVINSESLLP
jgi:hypothetical protein